MPSIQALREQRASIWSKMTEIMDKAAAEGRDLSGEESTSYDRMEGELDSVEAQIARAERHEERSTNYDAVDRTGVVPAPRSADPRDTESYTNAFPWKISGNAFTPSER